MTRTKFSVLIVSGVLAIGLAGCTRSEEGGTAETGALGSKMGDAVGQSMGDVAKTYGNQLDEQNSQLASLKSSADELGDQELNQLIDTIDTKLKALSGKLNEIKSADEGSTAALQKEIKALSGEVANLLKQAQTRLAEVQGG